MNILTNQEFNAAIGQFKGVLLDNLQSMIKFKVVAIDVKHVNDENYLFACITFGNNARLEFTISYDNFYQVPIFCFRIYIDERLNFDIVEIGENLRESSKLILNKVVEISITDHHLLNQPWFQIHPCETLDTLHTHVSSQKEFTLEQNYKDYDSSIAYLSCWFGLYALPAIFPQFSIRPIMYS